MDELAIQRQAREFLSRPYYKVIVGNPEDGYLVKVPDLPGCVAGGRTEIEAVENLPEAMALWFESMLEDGLPIPEPSPAPTLTV
jgi:predicted RNase H-like HicB family nuclease